MQRVVAWLSEKNPGLDGPIGVEEDLIEARLIDSMDFLEFIDLLEEISGESIDLQEVTIDDFRTRPRQGALPRLRRRRGRAGRLSTGR